MFRIAMSSLFIMLSANAFAFDIGVAGSSEGDLLVGVSSTNDGEKIGLYGSVIFDGEKYFDGSLVAVCRDGGTTTSTGSGTCSGHGGISRYKEANFSRLGFVVGMLYPINNWLSVNAGLVLADYSSDVSVGDGELSYGGAGVDFGVKVKLIEDGSLSLSVSRETEKGVTFLGLWHSF